MDRLERVSFLKDMAPGRVFLSTEEAVNELVSERAIGVSIDS